MQNDGPLPQLRAKFRPIVRQLHPRRYSGPFAQVQPTLGGSKERGRAYHDVPGKTGLVHRQGSMLRVEHILQHTGSVEGLRGLDIGCSVGGISVALELHGARMVGIDYDKSAIDAANGIARKRNYSSRFRAADLTNMQTWSWIESEQFDFAIWLSNFMWLEKQVGARQARSLLLRLSESIPTLVFETAQGPKDGAAGSNSVVGADGVMNLLAGHTAYTDISNIGSPPADWLSGRSVFLCRR